LRGGQHRRAIHEDNVASYAESGMARREFYGALGSGGCSHERRGGESTAPMGFSDGAVDALGQAEVVGIEDESLHWASVSSHRGASGISVLMRMAGMMEFA